jgi:hypothetical protein
MNKVKTNTELSQQINQYLKTLSLHRIKEIYNHGADNAAHNKLSYQDYLHRLLENQVLNKIDRSINIPDTLIYIPSLESGIYKYARVPDIKKQKTL